MNKSLSDRLASFGKRILVELCLRLISILRFIAKLLPSRPVLWFSSFAGGVTGKFCGKDRRISIAQLGYVFPNGAPKNDEAPSDLTLERIANDAFRHVGESFGELLMWEKFLRPKENSPESITSATDAAIENLRKSRSGALGLSAHFGSFELLAAYLAERGLPCAVIGRSPNYPALERAVKRFRSAYGVSVIWADAPDGARQIVHALRKGMVICALIDQDTKWKSEFSPFFGLEAASPTAPILLAMRMKVPMFTSFIVRTERLRHVVTTELIDYDASRPDEQLNILRVFNSRLERLIQAHPEQYIWWHRRWRRRPGVDYHLEPWLLPGRSEYANWLAERKRQA